MYDPSPYLNTIKTLLRVIAGRVGSSWGRVGRGVIGKHKRNVNLRSKNSLYEVNGSKKTFQNKSSIDGRGLNTPVRTAKVPFREMKRNPNGQEKLDLGLSRNLTFILLSPAT